jgi:hypothetical protein
MQFDGHSAVSDPGIFQSIHEREKSVRMLKVMSSGEDWHMGRDPEHVPNAYLHL